MRWINSQIVPDIQKRAGTNITETLPKKSRRRDSFLIHSMKAVLPGCQNQSRTEKQKR